MDGEHLSGLAQESLDVIGRHRGHVKQRMGTHILYPASPCGCRHRTERPRCPVYARIQRAGPGGDLGSQDEPAKRSLTCALCGDGPLDRSRAPQPAIVIELWDQETVITLSSI